VVDRLIGHRRSPRGAPALASPVRRLSRGCTGSRTFAPDWSGSRGSPRVPRSGRLTLLRGAGSLCNGDSRLDIRSLAPRDSAYGAGGRHRSRQPIPRSLSRDMPAACSPRSRTAVERRCCWRDAVTRSSSSSKRRTSAAVRRCRLVSGANERQRLPARCPQTIADLIPMTRDQVCELHFRGGRYRT
jgi:hypothetical protein